MDELRITVAMVSVADVERLLVAALEPTKIGVSDVSDGCGYKFDVFIVSDKFVGKRVLERHRMVNEALKDLMATIHAVTIKALTKEQYAAEGDQ